MGSTTPAVRCEYCASLAKLHCRKCRRRLCAAHAHHIHRSEIAGVCEQCHAESISALFFFPEMFLLLGVVFAPLVLECAQRLAGIWGDTAAAGLVAATAGAAPLLLFFALLERLTAWKSCGMVVAIHVSALALLVAWGLAIYGLPLAP